MPQSSADLEKIHSKYSITKLKNQSTLNSKRKYTLLDLDEYSEGNGPEMNLGGAQYSL